MIFLLLIRTVGPVTEDGTEPMTTLPRWNRRAAPAQRGSGRSRFQCRTTEHSHTESFSGAIEKRPIAR